MLTFTEALLYVKVVFCTPGLQLGRLTSLTGSFEREADAGVLCKNPVCVGLH
ncbi:Uncharacterised protein [Serratia quinivorans]|nr:Uncharacterised protein [Serratia quinivorans]